MTDIAKKSMKKPLIITIVGLVILFGGLFSFGMFRSYMMNKSMASFKTPPQVISATKVVTATWKPFINSIGTIVAIKGVSVTPEIAGLITHIYFQSGDKVKAGQPLIKLDTSLDEQDFKNYQAQYLLAKITYDRQRALYISRNVSNEALDQARAAVQQDKAIMDKTGVTILQKTIRAPFSGKIGIRQVNIGQYVSPGDALVTLQSLDPLYMNFSLPQQNVKALYTNQPIELTVDAFPNQTFNGTVSALNAQVDSSTRNILIQATVPNPKFQLLPGMFATVKVILPQQQNVMTVPQTAINYSLFGNSVFVLVPPATAPTTKNAPIIYTVKQVYVTTGEQRGSVVAITKGLTVGEEVVTSGQLKLDDGSPVMINNSIDLSKATIPNGQLY